MSYYDWVKIIKTLKDSPMDDSLIEKLKKQTIEKNKYMLARLIIHIYDTVDERLNRAGYKCLKELVTNKADINLMELDLINLKKEKKYVLDLINLSIFEVEQKELMKKRINLKYKEIVEFLENQIKNIDTDGTYMSVFEKNVSEEGE